MTVNGPASIAHAATGSRPPRWRTSPGSAHSSSANPVTSTSRISSAPVMTFEPVSDTTPLASRMKNGPYGAGWSIQNGCTFSTISGELSTVGSAM
jgi:hypothetical protein